ncbi:MFS transporter [Haloferacaceae archaeon DSL9]
MSRRTAARDAGDRGLSGSGAVRDRLPRGPILKYYLYIAATYASFISAVWVLFVRGQGLSFAQVGALNALWWAGLVCAEIPTGYLGDRIGRRDAMILGTVLTAVAIAGMGVSTTFAGFAVVFLLWAVGQTFRTGNEDAWLYDMLAAEAREHDFSRVRGRAAGIGLAIGALAAPAGGALADVDFRLPFFLTAVVYALAVPVLLTVPKVTGDGDRDEDADTADRFTFGAAIHVIRTQLARPPLRAFALYFALLFGVVQMTYIFDQPVIEALALDAGVPPSATATTVGLAYGAFTVVAAAISYQTGWIRDRIGTARWFTVAPLLTGVVLLALWLSPALAIPAFFLGRAVNAASYTLANHYINERVRSVGRATTLSAASMVFSLGAIPFELVGGYAADVIGPLGALSIFGGALLVGSACIWLWERPVGRANDSFAAAGDDRTGG